MKKTLQTLFFWALWILFLWAGARLSYWCIVTFEIKNADVAAWTFLIITAIVGAIGLALVMWIDEKINGPAYRP